MVNIQEENDNIKRSTANIDIKNLLEKKKYVIVLDTNILLKIYRASPDYAEYMLACLSKICDYVWLPNNVSWEYEKHRTDEYNNKKNSIEANFESCTNLMSTMRAKIEGQCKELVKKGYPGIGELTKSLLAKATEIETEFEAYFDDHQDLKLLNEWDTDRVNDLFKSFHSMPEPHASFIYKICREGEGRYKKQIPPGYKDNKKDGVSKYGDLIVWIETINYAAIDDKNIIFVTDDVKEDWWKKDDNGSLLFREELVKEFARKTKKNGISMDIIPLVGYDFYKTIACAYDIEAPDAVELALDATDDAFADEVADSVFDEIWGDLVYSGTTYLDEDSAHVGSEGIDEWELNESSFEGFERIDVGAGFATYIFEYSISVNGTSHDYWGRDYDTKEIIMSPGRTHECSGRVHVTVTRNAEASINWSKDFEYVSAVIDDAELKEDSYEDYDSDHDIYCSECGKKIGYEWDYIYGDYLGNPLCEDCMVDNKHGFICPHCGEKYPESMRGASGMFCENCERELDV